MSEVKNKELQVAALENGTAIDHIPSDKLFKVATLLGLDKEKNQITIGNNFPSNKMGSKGMIKIANKFFAVTLPEELVGLVKCNNPKCITNNEPMPTRFHVINKETGTIKCHYCERKINKEDIIIK